MKLLRASLFLLLAAGLAACGNDDDGNPGGAANGSDPDVPVCQKYDSCGCQDFDECLAATKTEPTKSNLAQPGVRQCLVSSTCESLCAGMPSACTGGGGGGGGGGGSCGDISCNESGSDPTCANAGCGECYFGKCTLF